MNLTPFRLTAALALALWAAPSFAAPEADAEQVRATTVKLINQLVEQGVLTREKADALLAEMNKPSAAPELRESAERALIEPTRAAIAAIDRARSQRISALAL